MSTKALALVVTLLLVGTTISVLEYLESSSIPVRRPGHESGAVQAAENTWQSRSPADAVTPAASRRRATETVKCRVLCPAPATPAKSGETEPQVRTAPPTLFQPDDGSIGG